MRHVMFMVGQNGDKLVEYFDGQNYRDNGLTGVKPSDRVLEVKFYLPEQMIDTSNISTAASALAYNLQKSETVLVQHLLNTKETAFKIGAPEKEIGVRLETAGLNYRCSDAAKALDSISAELEDFFDDITLPMML
jgi:hypothetical protein